MAADIPPSRGPGRATLIMGQIGLSVHAVVGAVVQEILEREGHQVRTVIGAQHEIFPLLGQGSIDLMVAAWLPEGHAACWALHGAGTEVLARLYEGARFFWATPDYVPEREVSSIRDLADPSVADRMENVIQGAGLSAMTSAISSRAIVDYGLDRLGYVFRDGTQADWIAAHDQAIDERRWFVLPTWTPQYLNRNGGLRMLADPNGVLGGANDAMLVAPRGRLEAVAPHARQVLSRVVIGLEGVIEMDWLVNSDGRTPRQAARAWMSANSRRVETWLRA
jgi:glycine betaine/proline transport system substrate-binding protein